MGKENELLKILYKIRIKGGHARLSYNKLCSKLKINYNEFCLIKSELYKDHKVMHFQLLGDGEITKETHADRFGLVITNVGIKAVQDKKYFKLFNREWKNY